jgi:hypothetical protein
MNGTWEISSIKLPLIRDMCPLCIKPNGEHDLVTGLSGLRLWLHGDHRRAGCDFQKSVGTRRRSVGIPGGYAVNTRLGRLHICEDQVLTQQPTPVAPGNSLALNFHW